MRIPRKNGEAVIVLGGRSGAFTFGFWSAAGAISAGALILGLNHWGHVGWQALAAWWGA